MDLSLAATADEVAKEMKLFEITDRPWNIQASCAVDGQAVNEGISWLSEIIKRKGK